MDTTLAPASVRMQQFACRGGHILDLAGCNQLLLSVPSLCREGRSTGCWHWHWHRWYWGLGRGCGAAAGRRYACSSRSVLGRWAPWSGTGLWGSSAGCWTIGPTRIPVFFFPLAKIVSLWESMLSLDFPYRWVCGGYRRFGGWCSWQGTGRRRWLGRGRRSGASSWAGMWNFHPCKVLSISPCGGRWPYHPPNTCPEVPEREGVWILLVWCLTPIWKKE